IPDGVVSFSAIICCVYICSYPGGGPVSPEAGPRIVSRESVICGPPLVMKVASGKLIISLSPDMNVFGAPPDGDADDSFVRIGLSGNPALRYSGGGPPVYPGGGPFGEPGG